MSAPERIGNIIGEALANIAERLGIADRIIGEAFRRGAEEGGRYA